MRTASLDSVNKDDPSGRTHLLHLVRSVARTCLRTPVGDNSPLMDAGLDSLGATELVRSLSDRLRVELEPTALFDHPTISSLVCHLTFKMVGID